MNKMIKKSRITKSEFLDLITHMNKMIKKIIGQWGYKPLVGDPSMGSVHAVSFQQSMIKQDLWIDFL